MTTDNAKLSIRRAQEDDFNGIVDVASVLPEWFDENARSKNIPIDINHQYTFVASHAKAIIGFASAYVHEGRLNIGWIGVRRNYQRKGVGTKLLQALINFAKENSIDTIAVMTLGDNINYPPYAQTRSFYMKNGFVILQRNQTDNPGCPEELWLIKQI